MPEQSDPEGNLRAGGKVRNQVIEGKNLHVSWNDDNQ